MDNSKYGLGVSDQKMDAMMDAILARGQDMADGKIQPESNDDYSMMWWTLLGRVRDQWTPLQKEKMDKIHENWRGRGHAELQLRHNKPTAHSPDEFPTYEQMLRVLEMIYRQIVPLVH